ncbi:ABC transporter substrate-binding protein [Picrophilus oshimae]|uniref:Extracellular solute-binding protein n=1 Tax=Picrophilus torridus (strain ATCC 700027 / DSM 9790 / JCM 10055 / NBRC 100828 / KAW 2/3) TaxID=1122961 RepID=Q6L348_PICTO|nr:ABC transporter substrate-binding protein [Picrophilus oshimae]AAT42603.1 extracellular solute-binding protein [Picrophilus oshimae DSM 9789]
MVIGKIKKGVALLAFLVVFFMIATAFSGIQPHNVNPAEPYVSSVNLAGNGTYKFAEVGSVLDISEFSANTVCDFLFLNNIYSTGIQIYPNGTLGPWLLTSWSGEPVSNITTFDPVTGLNESVRYIYTVHIRPGVQWTDWTQSNSNDTYVFSNSTSFVSTSGKTYNYQYKSFYDTLTGSIEPWKPVTMKTYYVQAADFILSWKILDSSLTFSGSFCNIANIVPVNNLTLEYYLTQPISTFVEVTLGTPVLPYHIWVNHDYSSTPGLWNYSKNLPASQSYNLWNLGFNPATGHAPGLIGTGPFMMNGGYNMPRGILLMNNYWELYQNTHYFAGSVKSLSQYMPRLYAIEGISYSSYSAAVAALRSGDVYTIIPSPPQTFLPTIESIPNTYVYTKEGTSFGFIQINPRSSNAPFNITGVREALEYAIPKSYITSVVDEGFDTPGNSVVPSSDVPWHAPDLPVYHFSISRAMETINQTMIRHPGLKYVTSNGKYVLEYHGKPVKMVIQAIVSSQNPLGVEGAEIIAKDWSAMGIQASVEQEALATAIANSNDYDYQSLELGISGISGNPTSFLDLTYNLSEAPAGYYIGPFSGITYNGPVNSSLCPELRDNAYYNGTEITKILDNLTGRLYHVFSIQQQLKIAYMIQYISAQELTYVDITYGVDPIPINNGTFTGITKDSLPLSSFWFWNFVTLHEKSAIKIKTSFETKLQVSVITGKRIYYNGEYGNATVSVRNVFGAPVSGVKIDIGDIPSGGIINVSSITGITNSAGIYKFEFRIPETNSLIYTKDYSGIINITATAVSNKYIPAIGFGHIDVSPVPVAYKILSYNGTLSRNSIENVSLEICNPVTGSPVSGYSYTIQTLAGAVNIIPGKNQILSYVSDIDGFGLGSDYVLSNGLKNYNMSSVSGVTGAKGIIDFGLRENSTFNDSKNTGYETYIFIGNYAAGSSMQGEYGYMTLGQVTSSYNGNGFGIYQPFEIPILISNNNSVSIKIISRHTVNYNGRLNITLMATMDGKPLKNYKITLTAQNALGANRGTFIGAHSSAFNPNSLVLQGFTSTFANIYGSSSMPEINVTTNSTGYATAVFTPEIYNPENYSIMNYQSRYYIPFDEFQISATGSNSTAATYIMSGQYLYKNSTGPFISYFVDVFAAGSYYLNGEYALMAGKNYTMYINSTIDGMAGPYAPGISGNITSDPGYLNVKSFNTGSSGSLRITINVPDLSREGIDYIHVYLNNGTSKSAYNYTFFIIPENSTVKNIVHTKIEENPLNTYILVIAVVFMALFLAMVAVYIIGRKNK